MRPQDVRALLWLKSREWLGESRAVVRLWLIGLMFAGWFGLVIVGSVVGARNGQLHPDRDLFLLAAAAWPLWAVIPLLGGGGGEVVAGHRLAPYPVSAKAVFGGAWLTALVDLPYLVVLPLVLGLSVAYGGIPGLVAALAFTAGASATGQLLAWVSFLTLAGRKRSGVAALLLTGLVVGGLGAIPALLPRVNDFGRALPGGWLDNALRAAHRGDLPTYLVLLALLAAPMAVALVAGPRLTETALDREARAGGVAARVWGVESWSVRGSVFRALVTANLRSIVRAVGAQVALAGVLAVPTITRLPGVDFAQVSLVAMGGVAGIAAATVLGVNAFAFDAGGAAVLLSWPVRTRDVLVAKATSVAICLLAGQVAVTLLGSLVTSAPAAVLSRALLLCLARTAVLTGLAMLWSVLTPAPSDYDSLRARISSPGAITTFVIAAATATYAVSQTAQHVTSLAGTLLVVAGGALAGAVVLRLALDALTAGGIERVATGVQG